MLRFLNTGSEAVMINELVETSATTSPLALSPSSSPELDAVFPVALPVRGEAAADAVDEVLVLLDVPPLELGNGGSEPSLSESLDEL